MTNPELYEQLHNPRHCYLFINGQPLRHRPNTALEAISEAPNPLAGQPLRFTRLAAERMAKQVSGFGRIIELRENCHGC